MEQPPVISLLTFILETYQISKQTRAHEGSIFSLCLCQDGSVISGGGKDRRLIQWSPTLTSLQEVEVRESRVGRVEICFLCLLATTPFRKGLGAAGQGLTLASVQPGSLSSRHNLKCQSLTAKEYLKKSVPESLAKYMQRGPSL